MFPSAVPFFLRRRRGWYLDDSLRGVDPDRHERERVSYSTMGPFLLFIDRRFQVPCVKGRRRRLADNSVAT